MKVVLFRREKIWLQGNCLLRFEIIITFMRAQTAQKGILTELYSFKYCSQDQCTYVYIPSIQVPQKICNCSPQVQLL